jgi:hypothetical protein
VLDPQMTATTILALLLIGMFASLVYSPEMKPSGRPA